MTRRARLVLGAIAGATAACLAFLPMRTPALPALGIWVGSVVLGVIAASALSAALDRRDHKAMFPPVWKEAQRVMRGRA